MQISAQARRLISLRSRLPILLGVVVLCLPALAHAQAPGNPGKPGKAHELFARDAGTWDCDVKMFFAGPGMPPVESKGVEVNELVSGGLYMRTSLSYPMGDRGEFEGHSLIGYDPRINKYVGTWVDNFTSIPSQISGEYDENSKTLTVHRTVVDGRGNELKSKDVTTWTDDSKKNVAVFLIVKTGDKELEIKLMEMTATKRP